MSLGVLNQDGTGGASVVKDGTTASFPKDVLEASKDAIVLVDFWASWCGPCKQLTPVIEKVVKSYNGKVRLVKINTDEHPAIAGQLRIQSLPTVYAFKDGRPVDGFTGAQPESAIRELIDRIIGQDEGAGIAEALDAADEALEAGDLQTAAETYAAVLQVDQTDPKALAGLAKCYLKSGDLARAEQTLALVPPDKSSTAAVSSAKAAIDLAKMADTDDNSTELESRVEADPNDHETRLELAVALAAHGKNEKALDHLLAIVRADRKWNDEAARKQLVKLFEAWGPKDPLTIDGRRRLSSILFS